MGQDVIPSYNREQAWFWSNRWQELEREVQEAIDAGRFLSFDSIDKALAALGENAE